MSRLSRSVLLVALSTIMMLAWTAASLAAGLELKLQLSLAEPGALHGKIDGVARRGNISIRLPHDTRASVFEGIVPGDYVGIVGSYLPSLVDARLLRVRVNGVSKFQTIQAVVGPAANGKVQVGDLVVLLRPPRATAAQLGSLPDIVTIENAPQQVGRADASQQVRVTRSEMNLRRIGRALHEYLDAHNQFPPAFLVGPDGKPWHSWRVLLLPYLGENRTYLTYRFDEPWDGPHNKALLGSIPSAYTDQPPGESDDHFTHYAAVTGPGMAFSDRGSAFDGKKPYIRGGTTTKMNDWRDGASTTLCVGTISESGKIPWASPVDIVVDNEAPALSAEGGFAAPYTTGGSKFGLFLRLDGAVVGIKESIEGSVFRSMLTINGREQLDFAKIDAVFAPKVIGSLDDAPTVYFDLKDGQPRAYLWEPE